MTYKQPRMSLKAKKRPVLCENQPAQTEERESRDYGWISAGKVIVRRKQYSSYNSPSVNGDNEVVRKNAMRLDTGVVFTQMSVKKGFKTVGEAAVAAMFKELKQLDEGPMPGKLVVQPVDVDTLSQKVKEQAMEAVNLIKIKRCEKKVMCKWEETKKIFESRRLSSITNRILGSFFNYTRHRCIRRQGRGHFRCTRGLPTCKVPG